jgi:hypothetical protein
MDEERRNTRRASIVFGFCMVGAMAWLPAGPLLFGILTIIFAYKGWIE